MRVGAIILAAGSSSRLGQPKQLALHRGEPLLRTTARRALEAGLAPIAVVLGHEAERCREVLSGLEVEAVVNPEWREGMGSSVRRGLSGLVERVDAAALLVCDQLHLDALHLRTLRAQLRDRRGIVASEYVGRLGVPAIFGAAHFTPLAQLRGDAGARKLLETSRGVVRVAWPAGAIDVDRPEDLAALAT